MFHRRLLAAFAIAIAASAARAQQPADAALPVSSRCLACHNNLKSSSGQDVSIGSAWRASLMANSARDPYWQASVRREALDHASASAAIQNECASCHMPLQHFADQAQKHDTAVFSRLPLDPHHEQDAAAGDGISCAVCHQAQPAGLGTPASYNGNITIAAPGAPVRPLFGPYPADDRAVAIHKVSGGFALSQSDHLRQAGLCGSCHTLYTTTLDAKGQPAGRLPEQMPYLEWLASSYRDKQSCQSCHMPEVPGSAPVATLSSPEHDGVRRHSFTGANFFVQDILDAHRDDLGTTASSSELAAASAETRAYLTAQAARLTISAPSLAAGRLSFAVTVQNLTGHKLPTAFPSRRAWLHITVAAPDGRILFESGHLNPDGSIAGNVNDADPTRFSPHYATITAPDQVQIFEPILGDAEGRVTTGLLTATQYIKDNRILPAGFEKQTASPDIAVRGKAASDPDFTGGSATTRYVIATAGVSGPYRITAALDYQPIGFRWARNLAPFQADETQRFARYFDQAAARSAIVLAHAQAVTPSGGASAVLPASAPPAPGSR